MGKEWKTTLLVTQNSVVRSQLKVLSINDKITTLFLYQRIGGKVDLIRGIKKN